MKIKFRSFIYENMSYKIVSLFIALILWLTILGRRDFTITRNVEIEFLVGTGRALVSQSEDYVKVKATGPRTALRRFIDSGASQVVTIDLSNKPEGVYEIEIPTSRVDVPFGVKVQSIRPSKITAQIAGKKE